MATGELPVIPTPILFALAGSIWGTAFFCIKLQLGLVAPVVSIVYRFALATLILLICASLRRRPLGLPWSTQRYLMLQGLLTFGISYVCMYEAERYLISSVVAVLYVLTIVWNAVGARLVFGMALTSRSWCACALAIIGVSLLFVQSPEPNVSEMLDGSFWHLLLGVGLVLIATVATSVGNLLAVVIARQCDDILLNTAWAMFWGTLWLAMWGLASCQPWQFPHSVTYWAALLYLSVFGSVIAFVCYFVLINRIGPEKTGYTGVLAPFISVVASIQFEDYHPGISGWLGLLTCLLSIVYATTIRRATARA